jgi:hypothetical protein
MKSCPACATVAPPGSLKCRQCGALVVAPPSAPPPKPAPIPEPVAVGAGSGDAPAGRVPVDDRFFAPAVLQPVLIHEPPRSSRTRSVPVSAIVLVVLVLLLGIGGVAVAKSMGDVAKQSADTATSTLSDAVKVEAESNRQRAFVTIAGASAESGDGAVSLATLNAMEPSLDWVSGTEASTTPTIVSLSQSDGAVIIAISSRGGGACAFGRFATGQVNEFVTLRADPCRAADAPVEGWQQLQSIPGQQPTTDGTSVLGVEG